MRFLDYVTINPPVQLVKDAVYPFVEMANVSTTYREPDAIEYKAFSSGVRFADGDTVIARIEPCLQNGKRFFVHNIGQGFGSTEFLVFRSKDKKIDEQFLYYLMQTEGIRKLMINSMTGATGRQRVNNDIFADMEFDFPDLPTQRRIASILSAYDDLIENNRRQIQLLEEAAQRLYREWFVELRFPGYENVEIVDGVPEGWQVVFLGDVIEFDPKVPLTKDRMKQSVPMAALSASSMVLDQSLIENTMSNSGSKFKNGDSLLARITPCLENGKTAFVDCLDCDEGAVGSTEFIVMRSKNLNPYMVYCIARSDCFRTEAINSMTGSDGRQRAQKDKLKALSYILPPKSLIDRFEQFAQPCFDKIRVLNRQNGFLVKARDKLLPKLMSGEMEE